MKMGPASTFRLSVVIAAVVLTAGCAGTGDQEPSLSQRRAQIFGTDATTTDNVANVDNAGRRESLPDNPLDRKALIREQSLYAAALVAPLGRVDYDGRILPLVRPGGGYIAVQEGASTPWETLFARPDAPPPYYSAIAIYRIEFDETSKGLRLIEHQRLEEIGVLGRSCDENGFLVECPKPDGSRWVGKVEWQTGAVDWLLRGGDEKTVNAFAALSRDGRLAWCAHPGGEDADDRFDLYVQAGSEVFRVPSVDGEWLFPTWANDNRSLFAWHLHDDGLLELAVMDATSDALIQRPLSTREVVSNGNRYVAYQAQVSLQEAASPDATPRIVFYHPGYDRLCLFDARRPGIRVFTQLSQSAAWRDAHTLVVGTNESLLLEDADERRTPAKLAKRPYAVRHTGNPLHPFILFAPAPNRVNQLEIWAMEVINDPHKAESAALPYQTDSRR